MTVQNVQIQSFLQIPESYFRFCCLNHVVSNNTEAETPILKLKLQYHMFKSCGKQQEWSWHSSTLATWCEELTHLKTPWCWERLKEGEGDDREWDGWMASPTQWTWVWVNSGSWWWTWRPGVLQSMGSQRVGHDWATELKWSNETENKQRHFLRESMAHLSYVSDFKSCYWASWLLL